MLKGLRGALPQGLSSSDSPTFAGETLTGPLDISAGTAGQIIFPAAQNASANPNTLDDYEEGTFTPAITLGGAAVGVTYGAQVGSYTKIGNRVLFLARVVLTSKGSSTGALLLTGLPFTSNATAQFLSPVSLFLNNLSVTAVIGQYGYVPNNSTSVTFTALVSGSQVALADTDLSNTSSITVSGSYPV